MRTFQRMKIGAACSLTLAALGVGAASAAEGEAARVRVSAALLDDTVQTLLPTLIRLPVVGQPSAENRPTLATMTELKYCGAGDRGAGRFRALLRLEASAGPTVALLGKTGCQGALADMAKRAGEGNEEAGIVVADLEAVWQPWELRFTVARAEGTTKLSKTRLAAVLEKRHELMTISIGDVRIQTDSGTIPLYAVPSFLSGAVEIAVVLGGSGAPSAPEKLARANGAPVWTADSNMTADVPLSFANQLLRRLTWNQPLVVSVNRDDVEVRNVSIAGEGAGETARVTLTGQATPASIRETARWTVITSGDPMQMLSIQMTPQMENCSGLGAMAAVGCNVRNGARSAAAEGFASSLTQRYQGAPIHQLGSPQTLRFSLAGERFVLSGDLLRLTFVQRGITAVGKFAVP
jgi:hypothetical protein